MTKGKILLLIPDQRTGEIFNGALTKSSLFQVTHLPELEISRNDIPLDLFDLILISDTLPDQQTSLTSRYIFEHFPLTPVILITQNYSNRLALAAIRQGFFDCLPVSLGEEALYSSIKQSLKWRYVIKRQVRLMARKDTKTLQAQLSSLQSLQKISSQITASLDLDQVLRTVVDASVNLAEAEKGSLLLLDENTGELTIRAYYDNKDDASKTYRLPVKDTIIEQVVTSGKPVHIENNEPVQILGSIQTRSGLYIPLKLKNRVIGVLGVNNLQENKLFTQDHIAIISALADFAAIAIQNAMLFASIQLEREKLETSLTNIEDGIIIIDSDNQFILINRKARELFAIHEKNIAGKKVNEYLHHPELIELIEDKQQIGTRIEISLEDGRNFYAQISPVASVGSIVTLNDITNLKQLDRIKSDFVNTVSHDLRSPLTAILGYVELIERVGPINNQQKDFIRRVQVSVHNITSLINDLLDLGRIEAGFDTAKEVVPLAPILRYTLDGLQARALERKQTLRIEASDNLPNILANPVRLRQMFTHLVVNAIKYTQVNGEISITAHAKGRQIIIQVKDNGQGIPAIDQPFIFDRFYRGGNISPDIPGTGLGLAIVKSIVENHQGRTWVDSTPGEGACFTIVLPQNHPL